MESYSLKMRLIAPGSIPGGATGQPEPEKVTLRKDVYACRISGYEVVTKHDEAGQSKTRGAEGAPIFSKKN